MRSPQSIRSPLLLFSTPRGWVRVALERGPDSDLEIVLLTATGYDPLTVGTLDRGSGLAVVHCHRRVADRQRRDTRDGPLRLTSDQYRAVTTELVCLLRAGGLRVLLEAEPAPPLCLVPEEETQA